ncbi:MAG: hypothetical protein ACK4IX_16355, partial [Candidatus Sericytochromatia bacterium]
EAADIEITSAAKDLVKSFDDIENVINVISVQQGPGEVMVAMKLKFKKNVTSESLISSINLFEKELKKVRPEVRWCFIEPDVK